MTENNFFSNFAEILLLVLITIKPISMIVFIDRQLIYQSLFFSFYNFTI